MPTLSALKFNSPGGADQALSILQRLQQQHLIQVVDAAVVSWPTGAEAPQTRQIVNATAPGALSGGSWGFLFGLLSFMPLLGLSLIDDNFIQQMREQVTPGTSALFLLSAGAVADRVVPELGSLNPELVTTNLSTEQEAQLRELFAKAQTSL